MKKRMKKLSLSRETIRHLESERFRHVLGGGDTFEIETGCACTDGCGGGGTQSCGCGTVGCTNGCPGNTNEIISGCATNC
jgi:hypothetical protein